MEILLLAIMGICFLLAVAWPAYIELSDGWNTQSQRAGEQIAVHTLGFAKRRRRLSHYTRVCATLIALTALLVVWDAYIFLQENSEYYFTADHNKETTLFMIGVAGLIIFLTLVYALVILKTKKKALDILESENSPA